MIHHVKQACIWYTKIRGKFIPLAAGVSNEVFFPVFRLSKETFFLPDFRSDDAFPLGFDEAGLLSSTKPEKDKINASNIRACFTNLTAQMIDYYLKPFQVIKFWKESIKHAATKLACPDA